MGHHAWGGYVDVDVPFPLDEDDRAAPRPLFEAGSMGLFDGTDDPAVTVPWPAELRDLANCYCDGLAHSSRRHDEDSTMSGMQGKRHVRQAASEVPRVRRAGLGVCPG